MRKRSLEIGSGAESHDEDDGEEPRFKDSDNRFMADCEESSQRYFIVSLLLPVSYHLSSNLYKSSCFFFLLAPRCQIGQSN